MVTRIAEWVYNSYLAELRKGSAGNIRRSKLLRKARRLLLKLADPDIFARLDGPLFFEYFPEFIRREGGDPDVLFNLLRRYGYVHFIFYDGGGNLLTSFTGGQADQI